MILQRLVKRFDMRAVLRLFRPELEHMIKTRWLKFPMERKLYVARKLGISVEQLDWLENWLQSLVLERLDEELR